ncbi:hypothetical protein Tcan_00283 [Toxocara canis]|uniref:Uncharacterized protein n=1 Tax=Toxocara canis TaxID=6265 RepID=A0A0B2VJ91_TOXCA|nr:hypothetical protein Tcan_00283 [Toxocara canis]
MIHVAEDRIQETSVWENDTRMSSRIRKRFRCYLGAESVLEADETTHGVGTKHAGRIHRLAAFLCFKQHKCNHNALSQCTTLLMHAVVIYHHIYRKTLLGRFLAFLSSKISPFLLNSYLSVLVQLAQASFPHLSNSISLLNSGFRRATSYRFPLISFIP